MKRLPIILLAAAALKAQVPTVPNDTHANVRAAINTATAYLDAKHLRGSGAPTAPCSSTTNLGVIYVRSDAGAPFSSLYVCAQSGSGTYSWEGPYFQNAVLTTGGYSNPSWITSLAYSKITGVPTFLQAANNLSDLANAGSARTNLGLGSAALQASSFFQTALGYVPLNPANNFSDIANAVSARSNLGLGSAALQASSFFQTALGFTAENAANKDAASGYAGLTSGGLLKATEMPAPGASSLGGVQSITCPNQVMNALSTLGVLNCSSVTNAMLVNPAMTINGTVCTLGGVCAPAGGSAQSVFTGSTAVNVTFSATLSISLADTGGTKSPRLFQVGTSTADTTVTFTSKTAGAEFSIMYQQATSGSTAWKVNYGSDVIANSACQMASTISASPQIWTVQTFIVQQDGVTLMGKGCISNEQYERCQETAAPGTPSSGSLVSWCDSTDHNKKTKNSSGVTFNQVIPATAPSAGLYGTYIDSTGLQHTSAGVAAVTASCGLSGSTSSGAASVKETYAILAKSANYTILTGDCGSLIQVSAAAAMTLPQAGSTGFSAGWFIRVQNTSASASVTIPTTTSTYYGGGFSGSSITLTAGQIVNLVSDGTNWDVPTNPPATGTGVSSVGTGCGLTGGTITGTGTIKETYAILAKSANYTILTGDCGSLLQVSAAATMTLAQAGSTGFASGWFIRIQNTAASGSVTVTTTTSTFYGAGLSGSSITIAAGNILTLVSDGTNWDATGNPPATGTGVTSVGCGTAMTGGTITSTGTCNVDTTKVVQKFFGTAAPGSVSGNLPGDLYSDTTNNKIYECNAASGTSAPACTAVTAGGWLLLNGSGSASNVIVENGAISSSTVNSNVEVNIASLKIPANSLGANDCPSVTVTYKFTGGNSTRSTWIRFSNTQGTFNVGGTTLTNQMQIGGAGTSIALGNLANNSTYTFCNQNATNVQSGTIAGGNVASAPTAGTVDTTLDSYINFDGAVANTGDTVSVVWAKVVR